MGLFSNKADRIQAEMEDAGVWMMMLPCCAMGALRKKSPEEKSNMSLDTHTPSPHLPFVHPTEPRPTCPGPSQTDLHTFFQDNSLKCKKTLGLLYSAACELSGAYIAFFPVAFI